ncbi:MAG TPA: BlaI/MecI/CopY family transcriptional regulator [Gemmatimonadales bacterium]|nr:BlaI/MecI/CopY family transcriptional regulator [Gemmatimonadales bacterium]
MPPPPGHESLGRRERQIMDVVYRLGRAAVGDVMRELPDPPTYSAVRAMLRYLERKGHLRHGRDGVRYVYEPTVTHRDAQRSALKHLVRTFFRGSRPGAVAALLELPGKGLTDADVDRLRDLVRRAQREGR